MDDKLLNYVKKSSYRIRILKSIGKGVKMPRDILAECDILPNHMSNVLKQLRENKIVGRINPEVRKSGYTGYLMWD